MLHVSACPQMLFTRVSHTTTICVLILLLHMYALLSPCVCVRVFLRACVCERVHVRVCVCVRARVRESGTTVAQRACATIFFFIVPLIAVAQGLP